MRRKTAKRKMPQNCVAQDGRLYFNRYHRGKRYSAPFRMPNSNEWRRRAGLIAKRIGADMALGVFDPNDHEILSKYHTSNDGSDLPTFFDYADIWLDKKMVLARSTQRTYRNLLQKHLTPYFSTYHVDQINKPMVENWLAKLDTRMSREYANECLRRLKSVLYDAEADYGFSSNIHRVKSLRSNEIDDDDHKVAIFSLEECTRLYYVMGSTLRTMMLCRIFAGLRTGEVIALKRLNVDLELNRLKVRANMSEGERRPPKSKAGKRDIEMHPVLRNHLMGHLSTHSHDFVFVSQRGIPFSSRQNFEKEFRRAKEKAGVRNLRWYAFRKLFASMRYASTGFVPKQIAKDMGHKQASLSFDLYSEAMPHTGCKFEEIEFPLVPKLAEAAE